MSKLFWRLFIAVSLTLVLPFAVLAQLWIEIRGIPYRLWLEIGMNFETAKRAWNTKPWDFRS